MLADMLRRVLYDLDTTRFLALWPRVSKDPLPRRSDAQGMLHAARVHARSLPLALRRLSHAWLRDRGIATRTPEEIDAVTIAEATGIAVSSAYPEVRVSLHCVMRDALMESEANGDPIPVTKRRMQAARFRERRALGLPTLLP